MASRLALDVGDIKNGKGVKTLVELRPEHTKGGKGGEIVIPERVRRRLGHYVSWKLDRGEDVRGA